MFRAAGRFVYDVIAGATAHVMLMIIGVIVVAMLSGKMDEGVVVLVLCVIVPFTCAGMFISHRGVRYPRVVSLLSGAVALIFPPVVIAAYWDWNWSQIGRQYIAAITGLPFSVIGTELVSHKRRPPSDNGPDQ